MSLSVYSGANQTKIRAGMGADVYALFSPATVAWQFRANGANNTTTAGSINVSSTVSGASTAVRRGMTVIVSASSDYASELRSNPENVLITWARKEASTGTLYIADTDYRWASLDYVTVLWDFRYFLNPTRFDGTNIYHDYDITYQDLKPRIEGLIPQVVVVNGASSTVSWAGFGATAMAQGNSISSYAWTFSDGQTSTSASPSLTFSTGVHWAHVKVTDSGGITNTSATMFAVIDDDFDDSALFTAHLDTGISRTIDSGATATFTALGEWTGILDGSPMLLFSRPLYHSDSSHTPIQSNIMFYGWLTELSDSRSGGDGVRFELRCVAGDIAYMLAQQTIPGHGLQEVTSPAEWGELVILSPGAVLWYLISEFTVGCANVDLFATYSDYRYPTISTSDGSVWQNIQDVMLRCSAIVFTTPQGTVQIERSVDLETDSTARSNASTIANFTLDDLRDGGLDTAQRALISQVQLGAGTFNTSTDKISVINASAPARWYAGAFRVAFDGNILEKDLTDAQATADAGKLAYNQFAAALPAVAVNMSLIDGYYELYPAPHYCYTVTVASGDVVSGITLDTNTRFIMTDVNIAHNNGTLDVSATMRQETGGGLRYAVMSQVVQFDPEYTPLDLPIGLPDAGIDTGVDDFLENVPASELPYQQDPTETPNNREDRQKEPSGVFKVRVPMNTGSAVNVPNLTQVDGTTYIIEASGYGVTNSNASSYDVGLDFDSTGYPNYWLDDPVYIGSSNAGNTTTGVITSGGNPGACHQAKMNVAFANSGVTQTVNIDLGGDYTVDAISFDGWGQSSTGGNQNLLYVVIFYDANGNSVYNSGFVGLNNRPPATWIQNNVNLTGLAIANVRVVSIRNGISTAGISQALERRFDNVEIAISSSSKIYADSVSQWNSRTYAQQLFASGSVGLLVNGDGSWRSGLPANANHVYVGTHTAGASDDGNPLPCQFVDPDGDYTNNSDSYILVRVIPQ